MQPFQDAAFAFTVAEWSQLPPATGAEVAFAGRSNAGKSSAINALTGRRKLAFVARQPGKTRTIQFYRIGLERYLVDLPGYGYARVSAAVRARWTRLLEDYLTRRSSLIGLVLIMDIRHPLTALDEQLLAWIRPRGLPVHILLTKADKVTRGNARAIERDVERRLRESGCRCTVQSFSSATREGVEQAAELLSGWLTPDAAELASRADRPL